MSPSNGYPRPDSQLPNAFERDGTIAQRCGQAVRQIPSLNIANRDPLGDVINWLDQVELGDDPLGDAVPCRAQDSDARELFADTGSEGAASPTVRSRSDAAGGPAGIQQLPLTAPPQLKPAISTSSSSTARVIDCCWDTQRSTGEDGVRSFSMQVESEDLEWDLRQKQTGAAGRMVIYENGERPREDIMLRGGSGRRIMVTAVSEGGKAARAGVQAGDVLVSINGKKDFNGNSADVVHATLVAPVLLVFLGFVGKLQAEVRLNYAESHAGMGMRENFLTTRPHEGTVEIFEEVVFQHQKSASSLFITTVAQPSRMTGGKISGGVISSPVQVPKGEAPDFPDVDPETDEGYGVESKHDTHMEMKASGSTLPSGDEELRGESTCASLPSGMPSAIYELHPSDARHLVRSALTLVSGEGHTKRMRTLSGPDMAPKVPGIPHLAMASLPPVHSDKMFRMPLTSPRLEAPACPDEHGDVHGYTSLSSMPDSPCADESERGFPGAFMSSPVSFPSIAEPVVPEREDSAGPLGPTPTTSEEFYAAGSPIEGEKAIATETAARERPTSW